jgi:hypothetical protein
MQINPTRRRDGAVTAPTETRPTARTSAFSVKIRSADSATAHRRGPVGVGTGPGNRTRHPAAPVAPWHHPQIRGKTSVRFSDT